MKSVDWKDFSAWVSRRGGLRRRLLVVGLALLGTALIINTLAGSHYTQRLIQQNAAELQKEIAARVAHEIEEFMDGKFIRLEDFVVSASFHGLGSEAQKNLALLLLKNDPAFTELAILDHRGQEVLKVSENRVYLPSELSDRSRSDEFEQAVSGKNYISSVYTSDRVEPYVSLAVPIRMTPQQVIGVVTVEANLKTLWDVIGNVRFGHAGYAYLVDGQGNLIAHRDSSLVLKRPNLSSVPDVAEFLQDPNADDPDPGEESSGITAERVISTHAPVRKLGWAVILSEPVGPALRELTRMHTYAGLLLGVGLLVGAFIIVWVSNRITDPLRALRRGVRLIGEGDLDHRVDIRTGDEIEELAQGFNKMAMELKNSYSNLEDQVEQRTRELSALQAVTSTVNQSLKVEPVLQEVIKKITEIFHFDATRIFLLNDQRTELHLQASFETQPEFFSGIRVFQRRQGIIGKVTETGEPMIFEDVQADPRYRALSQTKATQKAKFSFFAVLPIRAKETAIGSILFIGGSPRKLTPEELTLLTSMAGQIGVAVQNAHLYEQSVARARELSTLYDLAASVNQSMDADVVSKEVIRKVLEVTHFEAARIYLIDPDTKELVLRAHHGLGPEFIAATLMQKVGVGLNGHAAATGEALFFSDIQKDPRYDELTNRAHTKNFGFRAYISLPLKTKTRTVGVMNFLSRQPQNISSHDIALLSSMSSQVGTALENISLFDETVKRAQQLSALFTVTAAVNQSLDFGVVLQEVIEKITETFRFDTTRIYLAAEHGDELHMKGSFPANREDVHRVSRFRLGQGIVGKVAESGEPLIFEDVRCDPRYQELSSSKNTRSTGFSFLAVFPIKARSKSVGTIVCNSQMPRRLTSDEVRLLTSMSHQIGVAVEHAGLFEQIKTRAQQVAALHAVTATVSRSLDFEIVLREAIEKVMEVVKFDAAWIYLVDFSKSELVLGAWKGISDEVAHSMKIRPVGNNMVGTVARTGQPLVFEDIQNDVGYKPGANRFQVLSLGFRALGIFPIKVKEKVLGLLRIASREPRHFTAEEHQLLGSIASAIGVALENANLFEEAKRKSAELEKLNRELEEASNAKSEFMAAMSHELRTPLNVIIGNADLLLDDFFGEIGQQQRRALEKIHAHSKSLLKLITDVLNISKIEAKKGSLDVSTFHIGEIISRTQDFAEQLSRKGEVKILWDVDSDLSPMSTDALKLEEILQNLIGNAFKFTSEGKIEIRIKDIRERNQIEFAVADTGIGIKEEDLPHIFEKFHQLQEAHTGNYNGVGLGLSIVKTYLDLMQGEIQVQSQPGKGSTFIVTLPYVVSPLVN